MYVHYQRDSITRLRQRALPIFKHDLASLSTYHPIRLFTMQFKFLSGHDILRYLLISSLVNIESPDELPHDASLHQGLHY